jgi:hypothetical protein
MKQTRRFSSAGYVTSEDSNSGMKEAYDDRIAAEEAKRKKDVENEGGKVSEGERVSMTPPSKSTSPAAPVTPAAPAKPRVVSKAELEKSGMSLRDFLNKERGLTRRADSSAPAKAESIAGPRDDGAYRGKRSDMKDVGGGRSGGRGGPEAGEGSNLKPAGAYRGMRSDMKSVGGGRSGGRGGPEAGEGSESKPAGAYRGMRSDPEPVGAYRSIRSDPKPEGAYRGMRSDMKKGGAVKKMASGGSVSSASKRADGIATKGKTRGKMC